MLRDIAGGRVKTYRERLKLSQAKLADKVDMTQDSICRIENGKYNIRIDMLEKICKGLGVEPYKLLMPEEGTGIQELWTKDVISKGLIIALHPYYLIVTRRFDPDISDKPFVTYGIAYNGEHPIRVEDISTREDFVKTIVRLCNELKLSPVHLLDVVDDFLG